MEKTAKFHSDQGAQKYFTQAAHAGAEAADTLKKERKAGTVKMAKLRALRLAKEAEDKLAEEARVKEAGPPVVPARRKRATGVKPPKMIRMSY